MEKYKMGRPAKRVEETVDLNNSIVAPDFEEPQAVPIQMEAPVHKSEEVKIENMQKQSVKKEPVNCLRNERIIVRFVPSPAAMIHSKGHVLYGGMADNATRSFVVPRLASTGQFKNVLTNAEKECLERVMGLEEDALSVYRRHDNFWDDSNPTGIGKVILRKQDNYLDLNVPEDYIKYKILLANKDKIAPSMQELEEKPKATYQFVIISESAEAASNLSKMDATMECYTEYGAIRNNIDTLRTIIEILDGRTMSPGVKLDFLQCKVNEYIQRDARRFLRVIKDELLPAKVLIRKSVEAGLIGVKNNTYYLREDGSPLCEMGEESVFENAARYISSIKHQELKYFLEAKLKQSN